MNDIREQIENLLVNPATDRELKAGLTMEKLLRVYEAAVNLKPSTTLIYNDEFPGGATFVGFAAAKLLDAALVRAESIQSDPLHIEPITVEVQQLSEETLKEFGLPSLLRNQAD